MGGNESGIRRLSEGQRECLRLVLAHKTSKEIAQTIGISPHTVDQRIRYAIRTLGVQTRSEAALLLMAEETSWVAPRYPAPDTQPIATSLLQQGKMGDDSYQRLMSQTLDLPALHAAEALTAGRHNVEPKDGYQPVDADALRELYRTEQLEVDRELAASPAFLEPASGGEVKGGGFLDWVHPGWETKLVAVVLVALTSITAVGSLISGLRALSDLLN
jgi:DNA-binding CsgD family transcriptional regulator